MRCFVETLTLRAKVALVAIAIWSILMIWFSIRSGPQHDYKSYLAEWKLILAGADPWSTDNAYGPLHNLLAYLLPLGQLAPKILIVAALIAANALLVRELVRTDATASDSIVYFFSVPANVLIISMAFAYGLNDALVAAFVVCAIIARCRGHLAVAGCILGFAILLKYYPIFLVPLFALDNGRFRFRLILGAVTVTSVGLAATIFVWGDAFLAAPFMGVERGPKILSVLSALQGHPYLIGGPDVLAFLIRTNAVFVAAVGALVVLVAWKLRLHWLEASVLGLLLVLLTYKVGHQQFYIPWLFLVAALPLAPTSSARRLAWLCLPFVVFLSVFQWGYAYGSDGYNEILGAVRRNIGFFALPFGIATVAAYFWTCRSVRLSANVDYSATPLD
jgi:hypothetical protein